jgi:hypothetical protein
LIIKISKNSPMFFMTKISYNRLKAKFYYKSYLWLLHCSLLQTTIGAVAVTPHGTPDSPVLHRTVRWIIAEWLPKFPKLSSSEWISLVHQTLSGAPDQGSLQLVLLLSIWTLSWSFYWFVLNLWTYRTYDLEQTS